MPASAPSSRPPPPIATPTAEFRYVTTIEQPQADPMAGTAWVVEAGKPGAQQT